MKLGPNQDRTYTTQAMGSSAPQNGTLHSNNIDTTGPAPAPISGVSMDSVGSGSAPDSVVITGAPGGGIGDDLPADASPEAVDKYIKDHFPNLAAYMGNQEIHSILLWAVRTDMSDAEIQGAIRNTDYWKTHGPESRAFDALLANDPTAAHQQINETKILVDQAFQQQGIHKTDAELGEIAKSYIRGGWQPAQR